MKEYEPLMNQKIHMHDGSFGYVATPADNFPERLEKLF
jgi:hypothetical protein